MTHSHGGGALYFLTFSHHISHNTTAMLIFLLSLILLSLPILIFSLYTHNAAKISPPEKLLEPASRPGRGSDPAELTRSIVVEVLEEEEEKKKRRKKRVKKKKKTHSGGADDGKEEMEKKKEEDLFPCTTSSSAVQRKIKSQYDQLVKSHESSSGLTHVQVTEFVNCLLDAKKELQHRSEVLQRKFTITKALLQKADRSSFDRLRKQIYKLELEQKRLEDDAFVYNWLQQQLKTSPAYKKILEIGAAIEMADKLGGREEDSDDGDDFADISFEELLAQEKKDVFWQRHKKIRSK